MRPSQALQSHREAVRQIVLQHHALNVRVIGSVLHGKDMDDSDLGLLVEPTLEAVTNNPDKFPAGYAAVAPGNSSPPELPLSFAT